MGIRTILAVPHAELTSPFVGLLRPVFELRSGETFKSNSRDYPNRGLVFTPSYYDEICDAIPPGYLVQLQVEENKSSSLPPTDPNYAKYIVCKNGWAEAERWVQHGEPNAPPQGGAPTSNLAARPRYSASLRAL